MLTIEYISEQLKKDFARYNFGVYHGLFDKYIIVEIYNKPAFSIWLNKKTGHKEIFDETRFNKKNWLRKRLKTRLLTSTYVKTPFRRRDIFWGMEHWKAGLPERQLIKLKITRSLNNIHIF